MAMLLGKKIGMTQVYDDGGNLLPVTVIQAGPCTVLQLRTSENDGYSAVQLGYGEVKKSRQIKSSIGHAKKAKATPRKFVREMRLLGDGDTECNVGDTVTVTVFEEGKFVDVTGISKGKGFAGCMKRHGFGGFPASHGCKRKHRAPGSISSFASDAGHGGNLKKGKRMAGQMGNRNVTTKNHNLISIDAENNLLIVKGAIPGPAGGYVIIRGSKKG